MARPEKRALALQSFYQFCHRQERRVREALDIDEPDADTPIAITLARPTCPGDLVIDIRGRSYDRYTY